MSVRPPLAAVGRSALCLGVDVLPFVARLALHRAGQSQVALIRAAVQAGHTLTLAHVWPNADRTFERRIKHCKNTPRYCPLCQGKKQTRGQGRPGDSR